MASRFGIGTATLIMSSAVSLAQPMLHCRGGQPGSTRGIERVAACRVLAVEEEYGRTATIEAPEIGLGVGQFVVVHAEGSPLASGRIQFVGKGWALVGFNWVGVLPAAGFDAVVLPATPGKYIRQRLPAACSLRCGVDRVASGGATCHITATAHDGFEVGDRLLVERRGLPIARLILKAFDDSGARADVIHLVANAAPEVKDDVRLEQNPAARRSGRLQSRVLQVDGKGDQTVWFPADADDGVAVDDRWTVREGGSYIGLVEVQELRGPLAVGQAFAAMCRRPVRVGDELVRRDPRDVRAGRAALQVFRVEGNYALVNAGEADQITRDQRLYVVRDGKPVGTVMVTTVKMDFCGTRIDPSTTNAAETSEVAAGDDVYVTPPSRPAQRRIATVEWAEADGRVASARLAEGAVLRPGDVVSIASKDECLSAGIVAAVGREGATLYVPPRMRSRSIDAGAEVYFDEGP